MNTEGKHYTLYHHALNRVANSSCRGHVDELANSVVAPRAWNRLPTQLTLLRSTDSFRHDLKTFLFHSDYGAKNTGLALGCALGLLVGGAIQVPQLQFTNIAPFACATIKIREGVDEIS